jgi:pimeloyl-ACP methyl ester carboxylesterase
MSWAIWTAVLIVVAGFPAALLMDRKLRQAKVAARLRIECNRGIVEERFVSIGEIDQWVGIRGEDRSNPVLFMVHGGPGCSYSIFTPLLRAWEKHFTVVQWDQRGGGKTYSRMGPRGCGEISLEQLTRDAIEVAEYLCRRLSKERVFLLASSLGSTFGTEVARRRPDLFYAYVGTDQNVGMQRGRAEESDEVLVRLRALGLWKGVRALERAGADPARWSPDDYNRIAQWTMKSDRQGFRRTMKMLKDAVWYAPGWGLRDI